MGTNYYWRPESNVCKECGHDPTEEIHIGKSSMGWCFALHVTEEIESLTDWRGIWRSGVGSIFTEYGSLVTADEMLRIITDRVGRRGPTFEDDQDFLDTNHAVLGPKGLLRSRIDGSHCTAHGSGTWDIMPGEFS